MSPKQEFETAATYLTIFRVYGSSIHLWPYNNKGERPSEEALSFKIFCHDRSNKEAKENNQVKVFVLPDKECESEKCLLQYQNDDGERISSTDMAMFMTAPRPTNCEASYAFDLFLNKHSTLFGGLEKVDSMKIGTVYLYLDPKFSSQGVQRMQIIGTHSARPIGQMQVEYLVVRNPVAYGVSMSRYESLSRLGKLDAGHRGSGSGCRADLPGSITENTVASFNYAARHGADMCELDTMCTSDGVPVVYHNYTLDTSKPGSTQIDELTLEELRNLQNVSIHDKNCKHNMNSSTDELVHESSRSFPTLAEVLQDVDKSCALNIELKWPQLLSTGKSEAIHYREINDNVDRILKCIQEHHNGRLILLSTFNADIAIMLRLKQAQFPVLFLTTGDCTRFNDPTTKSVKDAVHFAQAFDLAGINPNVAYLNQHLVSYAQKRGLLVYAWGKIETTQAVKELKSTGLNGIIYDKIDLIKPQDD